MPKADGSVVIQTSMDISKADKELDKLQRNIEKTEEKLNKATRGRNEAESAAILDEQQLKEENRRLDELKAKLAELREAAKGRHGDEGAKAQIFLWQETRKGGNRQWLNMSLFPFRQF